MAESAKKFVPRSARYILRPQDRNIMRFGLEDSHAGATDIRQTLLVNLSETGAAFITDSRRGLHIGERIMVEIPVPQGEQIAWWGTVTRLQEYQPRRWFQDTNSFFDEPKILVAIRFDHLPEGHTRAIRKGIEKSYLQAVRDQRYRTWLYYRTLALKYSLQFFAYVILTILALGFIYYFSQPSSNYDEKRGAPWGDRFKIF
jgi:hypothetical protein